MDGRRSPATHHSRTAGTPPPPLTHPPNPSPTSHHIYLSLQEVSLIFVESICDDPDVLQRNYRLKLQNNGRWGTLCFAGFALPLCGSRLWYGHTPTHTSRTRTHAPTHITDTHTHIYIYIHVGLKTYTKPFLPYFIINPTDYKGMEPEKALRDFVERVHQYEASEASQHAWVSLSIITLARSLARLLTIHPTSNHITIIRRCTSRWRTRRTRGASPTSACTTWCVFPFSTLTGGR